MASGFKEISLQKRKTDRLLTAGLGLLALLVYGMSVSKGVFPGESAQLTAVFSGLIPLNLPTHPIWGAIVSWLSSVNVLSLPLRLNLFSALCTAGAAALLYRVVSFIVYELIQEEYSVEHAPRVSFWAGTVSALAFIFAIPVWQAATHLQYQGFDMLLVLAAASFLVSYADKQRSFNLALFALLYGVGVVESTLFITLAPVFLFFLFVTLWKSGRWSLTRLAWMGLLTIVGLSLYFFSAKAFLATHDGEALGFASVSDVMEEVWKSQVKQLKSGLPRHNWLTLLLVSVVPWVASGFASVRALNNERSWSQYILHLTLTVMVALGLCNAAISPWEILKPYGLLPVWAYAMLAMTTGYLVAYWYLLLKVHRPKRGNATTVLTKRTGDWLGLIVTYPLIAIVLLAAVINVFTMRNSRGDFADRCAKEILDRMGERTWFVTDGTLDAHLLIMAKERGQELNLLRLQNDMNPAYLKQVSELVAEKKLFSDTETQRMQNSIALGILPFIQDWFALDKDIDKKVAVFGVPDFWYSADLTPVPEYFFFTGSRDINEYKGKPLLAEYTAFWEEMDSVLAPNTNESGDPTVRLRAHLRRHMGFVANNLGVLLEDIGNEDDAFKAYTYVHSKIDPDNISAMFNRFEMARRGVASASASKDAIERELKDFISNLKRQYPLWSLSRYYGYVRSPELFARLGWGWALSGQTGAALKGLRIATDLLSTNTKSATMLSEAAIYSLAGEKGKTEAIYQDLLKSEPGNRSAMLGLARLAMQEGAIDKARNWLDQAAHSDDKRGALGVEWATIHLMNNDIDRARLTLQETTDLQPKNLQAWSMLAMVNLQQDQLDEIETVILPKMENIAGTIDNYYIQITRAQTALSKIAKEQKEIQERAVSPEKAEEIAQKKILPFQHQAREAFIRASMLRPDIAGVKDAILQLDIGMNDKDSAALHARQVLRSDRKHALANYVMGSLRLQEGEYGEAEDFLRRSVEASPSSASLNDLAEVLRRIRKFDDAEKQVRAALKLNPDLYVAWETLAAILLEADKNIDEAEQAARKSLELHEGDIRVKITLARILLKKGEVEQAREMIRQVRNRQNELSAFDQAELAKLSAEASSKK